MHLLEATHIARQEHKVIYHIGFNNQRIYARWDNRPDELLWGFFPTGPFIKPVTVGSRFMDVDWQILEKE